MVGDWVLAGDELLIAHYGASGIDWQQVADRDVVETLRGKVVAQATVLEDLVDEFLLYLRDTPPEDLDTDADPTKHWQLGRKVDDLRAALKDCGLAAVAKGPLDQVGRALKRRDVLAHSPLMVREGRVVHFGVMPEPEFVVRERKRGGLKYHRLTEAQLRDDLRSTATAFLALLGMAEVVVQHAPLPKHFRTGAFLAQPDLHVW